MFVYEIKKDPFTLPQKKKNKKKIGWLIAQFNGRAFKPKRHFRFSKRRCLLVQKAVFFFFYSKVCSNKAINMNTRFYYKDGQGNDVMDWDVEVTPFHLDSSQKCE